MVGAVGHDEVGEGVGDLGWKKRAGWKHRQAQKGPTIRSKVGCHPFAGQYAALVPTPVGIGAIIKKNGCSPHDRVDGCPHKQQDFVGRAPGQLPQAITTTRYPMRGKQPDQDGPQLGQGHKDGPLRPHSPRGGKIWGAENMLTVSLPLSPCPLVPPF